MVIHEKEQQTQTNAKPPNDELYLFWSHQYQEEEQTEKHAAELRQKA